MYPVISLLRRAASKVVYVEKESLGVSEGAAYLSTDKPITYLDLSSLSWKVSKEGKAPFSEIVATGPTSSSVASRLTARENEIYEKMKLANTLYTLFFGPGEETEKEGVFTRRVRIVSAQGVWGWPLGAEAASKVPLKQSITTRRKLKLPPGTILERR